MSRLRSLLHKGGLAFALNAFIAYALCLPLLHGLGLAQEAGRAAMLALFITAAFHVYSLLPKKLRFVLPLAVILYLVLGGLFWKGSVPNRALSFLQAAVSGAPLPHAVTLYWDALLPILMVLLAMYGRLLMEGDPAFSLPLMAAPVLLVWFLGARKPMPVFLPAVACLPLLYLYTGKNAENAPVQPAPKGHWLKGLALAAALVLVAFSLTPKQRSTLPQMERLADQARQRIEDMLQFTSTRTAFSLSMQGYQPMGSNRLGGKPNISQAPVMTVQAEQKVYLRGTILDTYTGRTWYDSLSTTRYNWQSLRYAGLRDDLFNEELPQSERTSSRQASVTLLTEMPTTLFVPQRLRSLEPGPNMTAYYNSASEVFITRDLRNGDTYGFRYEPYVAGEAGTDALAARLATTPNGEPVQLNAAYFQMPEHLQPGGLLYSLAEQLTGNTQDAYQKALTIRQHLRSRYTYSLEVPPVPETQDFAEHFLFDQQSGYCTYFATAMTVLARASGLPARYVEGFLADPQGQGSVTLTGMNAHAWAEIYIDKLGWVVFDATAPEGGETDQQGEQEPSPEPSPEPTPSPSPSPSPEPSQAPSQPPENVPSPSPPPPQGDEEPSPSPSQAPGLQEDLPENKRPPFPFWILLVLAAIALVIWRVLAEEPSRKEKRLKSESAVFSLYYGALLDVNRVSGKGIHAQETPLSYMARIAPNDEEHQKLAGVYSAWAYGKRQPEKDEAAFAGSLYRLSWRGLPWYKKAQLSLIRALRPIRKLGKSLTGFIAKKPYKKRK